MEKNGTKDVALAKVGVGRSNRLARSSFQNAKALI
jgi:hypothetical protein